MFKCSWGWIFWEKVSERGVECGWRSIHPPSQLDLEIDQQLRELRWRWVLPRRFHPMFIQDLLCYCCCAIIRRRITEDVPSNIFGNVTF